MDDTLKYQAVAAISYGDVFHGCRYRMPVLQADFNCG